MRDSGDAASKKYRGLLAGREGLSWDVITQSVCLARQSMGDWYTRKAAWGPGLVVLAPTGQSLPKRDAHRATETSSKRVHITGPQLHASGLWNEA